MENLTFIEVCNFFNTLQKMTAHLDKITDNIDLDSDLSDDDRALIEVYSLFSDFQHSIYDDDIIQDTVDKVFDRDIEFGA